MLCHVNFCVKLCILLLILRKIVYNRKESIHERKQLKNWKRTVLFLEDMEQVMILMKMICAISSKKQI